MPFFTLTHRAGNEYRRKHKEYKKWKTTIQLSEKIEYPVQEFLSLAESETATAVEYVA